MPHLENDYFDVPEPRDIDPNKLIPQLAEGQQKMPPKAREEERKKGNRMMDRVSIWDPPSDEQEAHMDDLTGSRVRQGFV